MNTGIQAAQVSLDAQGTPFSEHFGDVYHSSHGALAQAREVFMAGNDLPQRFLEKSCFTILETGFGLGINFLSTWHAWQTIQQNHPKPLKKLHFISIEAFPLEQANLAKILQNFPELQALSESLIQKWPILCSGMQRIEFSEDVSLTLIFGDARTWLPKIRAEVDAFYLDGFAPAKNPELWNDEVFRGLARLARAGTTLATYTVAGAVRRGLEQAGFAVQKSTGFAGKRQKLSGHFRQQKPRHQAPQTRDAIIIGAGLAGCALAERLSARGFQIKIFEQNQEIARGASGNHAGILMPIISRDDNAQARLSRAAFGYSLRLLQDLQRQKFLSAGTLQGVTMHARDAAHHAQLRDILTPHHPFYPQDYVRWQNDAAFFPQACALSPRDFCQALLKRAAPHIQFSGGQKIANIAKIDAEHWAVFDAQDQELARSAHLILANGSAAATFAPDLPLGEQWRAVSLLAADSVNVSEIHCGRAYFVPNLAGLQLIGSCALPEDFPKDFKDLSQKQRQFLHEQNLTELRQLLPEAQQAHAIDGRICARPSSPDRLPLIGAVPQIQPPSSAQLERLPRQTGLFCSLGFGARGLTWAALAAEILACQINAEPAPVENDLLRAIDPARFAWRNNKIVRRKNTLSNQNLE